MKATSLRVALAVAALFSGCDYNERNIRQYKQCQAAEMEAVPNYGGGLTCMPPKKDPKP